MKKIPLTITFVLIAFIVIDSIACVSRLLTDKQQQINNHLKSAEDYISRELYQLAIKEYQDALLIEDSEEVRGLMLEAYQLRYEESPSIYEEYTELLKGYVAQYPDNTSYYTILGNLYISAGQYQDAYNYLNDAHKKGYANDEIDKLLVDLKYKYEDSWETYDEFLPYTNDYCAASKDGYWQYLDKEGIAVSDEMFDIVSQIGENGIRISSKPVNNDDIETKDIPNANYNIKLYNDEIIKGKSNLKPLFVGYFAEELVPIETSEGFGYYDSLIEHKFGKYKYAGRFVNGKAAVKLADNKWVLVDNTGKEVSKNKYQEIIVGLDTSWLIGGNCLVKINDKYAIYNELEEQVGSFDADDVDVLTEDGLIAFKKNNKWGYVNTNGEIVIEPKYDMAKSFSKGLAAVKSGEKWGFIDAKGNSVIDSVFRDADYFNKQNSCFVKTNQDKWCLIHLVVNSKG